MKALLAGEPIATAAGRVLTPAPGMTLADLDSARLFSVLAESGFLLLRGFNPSLESYSDLVQRCSTRTMLDPARVFQRAGRPEGRRGHRSRHAPPGERDYPVRSPSGLAVQPARRAQWLADDGLRWI